MIPSKFAGFLVASLALSTMAEARYLGPILVKETRTGLTLPEYYKGEVCEIYADRVVLTTTFGGTGLKSVKTVSNTLQGNVQTFLQKASKGSQVKYAAPADGNSVRHYGNIINPNDTVAYVGLTYENNGTGELIINQSPEARTLRFVIDTLCPNTLQGSVNPGE